MAGLPAGPPAIRLRHSADSPCRPLRGRGPPHCSDWPANEYRGAQDVHKMAEKTPLRRTDHSLVGCRLK